MEKSLLRKHFLAVRRGITENDSQTSEALCRAVSLWLSDKYFRCIGFYAPFRGEPDITPAVVAALSCGRAQSAALPVIDSAERSEMHYALWSPAGELRKNVYGIAEPGETAEVFPDVIFSPCVAFNRRGFRLGNGKGFFDRYLMLPQVRAAAPQTVAVGYEALLTDAFASEPHDVAFGWTATEKGVVKAL